MNKLSASIGKRKSMEPGLWLTYFLIYRLLLLFLFFRYSF